MREATRLLMEHAVRVEVGNNSDDHNIIDKRVGIILEKMSVEVKDECERIGAWGILGQGTGGHIVQPGSRTPVNRHDLIGESTVHSLSISAFQKFLNTYLLKLPCYYNTVSLLSNV